MKNSPKKVSRPYRILREADARQKLKNTKANFTYEPTLVTGALCNQCGGATAEYAELTVTDSLYRRGLCLECKNMAEAPRKHKGTFVAFDEAGEASHEQ